MANGAAMILDHCCFPFAAAAEVASSFVLSKTFDEQNFVFVKLHTVLHILPAHNFLVFSLKMVARKIHCLH